MTKSMVRMLQRISNALCSLELLGAGLAAAVVMALIVLNVVTRAMNMSLFWVDEAAIYVMVWMIFLATAVTLKRREALSVTVLVAYLPPRLRALTGVIIDFSVLLFAVLVLVFSWFWYAPLDLVLHGFDLAEFSAETLNFMYQEHANTFGLSKFWVWLIIPYFGCSVGLHALANLCTDPRGRYMNEPHG